MRQGRQFQPDQRRQLRRLQHHRIARHQRRQCLRRRNRKRIIPRRNDSDHSMRFAHQPPTLQLGSQIPMRHRLIAQQLPGVLDQESCRVEHHENLGSQRLRAGLTRLPRNGIGDLRFLLVQLPLKHPKNIDSTPHSQLGPRSLRAARPGHSRLHTAALSVHSNSREHPATAAGFTETILGILLGVATICRSVSHVEILIFRSSSAPSLRTFQIFSGLFILRGSKLFKLHKPAQALTRGGR